MLLRVNCLIAACPCLMSFSGPRLIIVNPFRPRFASDQKFTNFSDQRDRPHPVAMRCSLALVLGLVLVAGQQQSQADALPVHGNVPNPAVPFVYVYLDAYGRPYYFDVMTGMPMWLPRMCE